MGATALSTILPGPVRQVGYVVGDLDATIGSWLPLGVGPWFVLRDQDQSCTYRGAPCDTTLSIAFANTATMQIELIQQHGDTPTIYSEFLGSGREGYHQLAWWADDFDATMAAVDDAGWPVVWSGGEGLARFAYVEPPDRPAPVLEIMELNDLTRGLDGLVSAAAVDWDGSDPIRRLG